MGKLLISPIRRNSPVIQDQDKLTKLLVGPQIIQRRNNNCLRLKSLKMKDQLAAVKTKEFKLQIMHHVKMKTKEVT